MNIFHLMHIHDNKLYYFIGNNISPTIDVLLPDTIQYKN